MWCMDESNIKCLVLLWHEILVEPKGNQLLLSTACASPAPRLRQASVWTTYLDIGLASKPGCTWDVTFRSPTNSPSWEIVHQIMVVLKQLIKWWLIDSWFIDRLWLTGKYGQLDHGTYSPAQSPKKLHSSEWISKTEWLPCWHWTWSSLPPAGSWTPGTCNRRGQSRLTASIQPWCQRYHVPLQVINYCLIYVTHISSLRHYTWLISVPEIKGQKLLVFIVCVYILLTSNNLQP